MFLVPDLVNLIIKSCTDCSDYFISIYCKDNGCLVLSAYNYSLINLPVIYLYCIYVFPVSGTNKDCCCCWLTHFEFRTGFTCLKVRTMLEADTQMNLREYRSFIDEEMFTILGQMDSASKIFDHVYLVSKLPFLL